MESLFIDQFKTLNQIFGKQSHQFVDFEFDLITYLLQSNSKQKIVSKNALLAELYTQKNEIQSKSKKTVDYLKSTFKVITLIADSGLKEFNDKIQITVKQRFSELGDQTNKVLDSARAKFTRVVWKILFSIKIKRILSIAQIKKGQNPEVVKAQAHNKNILGLNDEDEDEDEEMIDRTRKKKKGDKNKVQKHLVGLGSKLSNNINQKYTKFDINEFNQKQKQKNQTQDFNVEQAIKEFDYFNSFVETIGNRNFDKCQEKFNKHLDIVKDKSTKKIHEAITTFVKTEFDEGRMDVNMFWNDQQEVLNNYNRYNAKNTYKAFLGNKFIFDKHKEISNELYEDFQEDELRNNILNSTQDDPEVLRRVQMLNDDIFKVADINKHPRQLKTKDLSLLPDISNPSIANNNNQSNNDIDNSRKVQTPVGENKIKNDQKETVKTNMKNSPDKSPKKLPEIRKKKKNDDEVETFGLGKHKKRLKEIYRNLGYLKEELENSGYSNWTILHPNHRTQIKSLGTRAIEYYDSQKEKQLSSQELRTNCTWLQPEEIPVEITKIAKKKLEKGITTNIIRSGFKNLKNKSKSKN